MIKGAAAVPLLSTLGAPLLKAAERSSVIVVGGGLSGLYSALLLADAGLDVTVLEASQRIGGRVYTRDGVETRPEFGASQIGRTYARVINLCSRLDLKLIPEHRNLMPMSSYLEQNWVRSDQWADSPLNRMVGDERKMQPALVGSQLLSKFNPLQNLDDWLNPKFADYDVSILELMQRNNVSPAAIRLAGIGNDLYGSSALGLMQEKTRGLFDARFGNQEVEEIDRPYGFANRKLEGESLARINNIEGGCSRMPEAMAAALGDSVQTGKMVRAIDMSGDRAEVRCVDGSRYTADFVISALPFSVLRNVSIYPLLQGPQADAVHKIGYAGTTRAFGFIEEPYWEQDGFEPSFFTDGTIHMLWALEKRPDEDKHRFMVVFTEPAASRIDQFPKDQALALMESEIARIRPSTKGKLRFLDMYGWSNNTFIRGCRHMFKPGQINAFAREMIVPHERLHFAGEHTRRSDFGMESALESGERAAFEIIGRA
ncbi:flavin monoamine oxidase family protein [Parahaliea maris]|uniref:flavin monoamine oxidase family protein n=1 Tax=Parahaliea maris TaxID=2716870 RepID=UPI00164FCDC7|nr:NAD(P)/FAD-dependent oxidoreductase [Parahaliea maris]